MKDRLCSRCVWAIALLSVLQGGLLLAATGDAALVEQLRDDRNMILTFSGVICTALISVIGVLWKTLRSDRTEAQKHADILQKRNNDQQREFVDTLKSLVSKDE